jgi:hypothetical protein
MTVKLRYKQPDGNESSLISVAVANNTRVTPELGFAAAVTEFGMLLRDSEYKGSSTCSRELAKLVPRAWYWRTTTTTTAELAENYCVEISFSANSAVSAVNIVAV